MTAAAARSAAVLRALRRAAVERRAVRVLLFLGGLLTAGFLYGGQAHAAESTQPVQVQPAAAAPASVGSPARTAAEQELRRVAKDSSEAVTSAASSAVETVRVAVEPVLETVDTVTAPLTEVPDEVLPAPLPPSGSGADPGGTTPLPADPSAGHSAGPATANGLASAGRSAESETLDAFRYAYVPADGGDAYAGVLDRPKGDTRQERNGPAQAPVKPCDFVPGALQQSGETHSPRSGDQQAAAGAYGVEFALVPGAGSAAAKAPTRERPRDILEFPG
ncbi:hypothetical protein [Streptomyces sp. NPDC020681]|uniref:hypothetical protein n=1 Tax=Streptomyces sp. NPDC020681 TaxID=3365083 RepID=UPI00378C09AD